MKKKVVSILLALSTLFGVAVDAIHAEEVQDGANTTASVATYLDTRPKDLSGLILTIPSEIELTARMASGKLAAYQAEDYISATGQLNGEYSLQVYVPEYNYMDINRSNYENYKRPNFYFKTKPAFSDISNSISITTFDSTTTQYSNCRYQYWDSETLLTGTKESNKKDFVLEFHDSGNGVGGWGDLNNKSLKGIVNFKVSTERKTPRRVVTSWTDDGTYTINSTNFLNTVDENGYMKVGGVAYKANTDEDCYMIKTCFRDSSHRSVIPEITSDKLKYLKLSDLFYEIDHNAKIKIKDCPNLETLEYSINSTNNGFEITNCTSLKKVYMYGADRKECVYPLWKQCSSITDIYVPNLIISEVKNVTDIATASGVTFHCLDGNYTVE